MKNDNKQEPCGWCLSDPIYRDYHDSEWGVPLRDEQRIFEFLLLEGVQAGLSWITVLKRRENYRLVYDNFDAQKIAAWSDQRKQAILSDARIIRNRLKVDSAQRNARAYLDMRDQGLTLTDYFWAFVEGEAIQNSFEKLSDVPAETPLSQQISKDLKQRGFNFVGPTIIYAHMQAMGLVNDHLLSCPRHSACAALRVNG
ncbi:DNA-3-methyladenine glycosylase I [Umboniibacter marinipuniceus]|uniref:DNA-3-methyladenine glycosylase I n=1 Tax=Umboniibacter marinipuniceus TaxID=569599 RepID=A0A3M0A634_9GAMM|nr:DNA-3-methyladenine glycosylase I [Umboniibacter marinipuniceus]RMA80056.1 DNA-3-methyladenine glycosylase I [Umboniibacter marinipuniceus]